MIRSFFGVTTAQDTSEIIGDLEMSSSEHIFCVKPVWYQ